MAARGWKSSGQAELYTGIERTTLHRMKHGHVPMRSTVRVWAAALGDPANRWLELAGYDPVPAEIAQEAPQRPQERAQGQGRANDIKGDPERAEEAGEPSLRLRHPEPPPEVLEAIREAPTREAKVRQAIAYLQRPELRLRFGSDGGESIEVLIQIVRIYEKLAGVQLLPPEII